MVNSLFLDREKALPMMSAHFHDDWSSTYGLMKIDVFGKVLFAISLSRSFFHCIADSLLPTSVQVQALSPHAVVMPHPPLPPLTPPLRLCHGGDPGRTGSNSVCCPTSRTAGKPRKYRRWYWVREID
jgi:hypothetical protein